MLEDIFYKYLRFYKSSPAWVKSVAGTLYGQLPYSLRYGNAYTKHKSLALESRYWTSEQHRPYQEEKIKALIDHAYQHVRFTGKSIRELVWNPQIFVALRISKSFHALRGRK